MSGSAIHVDPFFTQLCPPRTYRRRAPDLFNAASEDVELLRWFYATVSQPSVDVPAEGYLHLPHCTVFDGRYILDAGFEWVEPSLADWGTDAQVRDWVVRTARETTPLPLNPGGTEWHYVLFAQCNAENYGHFLCEAAPKLAHVRRAGWRKVRYLLPEACARYEGFTTALLGHLDIEAQAMPVATASFHTCRDLLYLTPVSQHDFRKSPTLLELREAALSLYGRPDAPPRRLFIERAAGERRRIANQDEVAGVLAEHGFEAVYPGAMDAAGQVALFSQASHIVGSVGAGLTNMLFARDGARVLYLSNGLIDPFFWDIAGLCDQRFSWLFAQPLQRFRQEVFEADYRVDLADLRVALAHTLGDSGPA